MIFYSGNDPEMVWVDPNPIQSTGPKPIYTYDEFFDMICVGDPTIKRKLSIKHETNENLEIVVLENTAHEHFYVYLIEGNTWIMKHVHRAVKGAEAAGRNYRNFYKILEYVYSNCGYHTVNHIQSLIRATKNLSIDDLFVEMGMAQKLIDACAPTPTGEDPF